MHWFHVFFCLADLSPGVFQKERGEERARKGRGASLPWRWEWERRAEIGGAEAAGSDGNALPGDGDNALPRDNDNALPRDGIPMLPPLLQHLVLRLSLFELLFVLPACGT